MHTTEKRRISKRAVELAQWIKVACLGTLDDPVQSPEPTWLPTPARSLTCGSHQINIDLKAGHGLSGLQSLREENGWSLVATRLASDSVTDPAHENKMESDGGPVPELQVCPTHLAACSLAFSTRFSKPHRSLYTTKLNSVLSGALIIVTICWVTIIVHLDTLYLQLVHWTV